MTPHTSSERGIALVMTLFLMAALSALAVSLMFLSQTETSSSRNYKTMSQARYAGEAGVHKAINFLLNSYTSPSAFGNYDLTKSPVVCTSGCTTNSGTCDISGAAPTGPCVVLASGMSTVTPNYPDATVKDNFTNNVKGSLTVGTASVSYGAYAVLMSMRSVAIYGGTVKTIQRWRIVADGTVSGAMPATVEVTAEIDQGADDADTYAIFATNNGCGSITMAGNEVTNSYNSNNLTNAAAWSGGAVGSGHPIASNSGGAVGTNGNLDLSGHVDVHGTLSTPRTGVGACSAGNITAETLSGTATVDNGIIPLAQAKSYPTPAAPSPLPPTTGTTATISIGGGTTCANLIALVGPPLAIPAGATCTGSAGNLNITLNNATLVWGNVSLSGGASLTITGGTNSTANFNVNSFTMAGNSTLKLGTNTGLVMNVAGQGITAPNNVLDFTGGTFSNTTFDPSKFQILYAGDATIKMVGGSAAAGTVYAPNAYTEMHGTADFYGSVLSSKFNDTGGATVHYDSSLSTKFKILGNKLMTSFSWKKY